MDSIARKPDNNKSMAIALLERIADTLERLEKQQDDYFAVDLRARYPFGKPMDRWRRRA